jgi:hypothetical protein
MKKTILNLGLASLVSITTCSTIKEEPIVYQEKREINKQEPDENIQKKDRVVYYKINGKWYKEGSEEANEIMEKYDIKPYK